MKHLILTTTFLSSFLLLSSLKAANINFSSTESVWEDSSGSQLPDGSQILIGNFDTSGAFNFSLIGTSPFDTYAEVSSFFVEYGSATTITVSSLSGVVLGNTGSSNDSGQPIYFWAFNDSTVTSATEWAIVSNSDSEWFVADDPNPGSSSIDLGVNTETRVIEFGTESVNTGLGDTQLNVQTGLFVPEPSTYALIAGFLMFGYVIVRRASK